MSEHKKMGVRYSWKDNKVSEAKSRRNYIVTAYINKKAAI